MSDTIESRFMPFLVFTWDADMVGDYQTEAQAIRAMEMYKCDVVTDLSGTILRWSTQPKDHRDKIAKRLADWFRVYLKPDVIEPDHLQTYLIEQNRELFEQCRTAQRNARFMERCGRSVGDIADKLEVENKLLRKQITEQSVRDSEIKALHHLVLQLESTLDSGLPHSERVAECHQILAGYYGMFGRPKEEAK